MVGIPILDSRSRTKKQEEERKKTNAELRSLMDKNAAKSSIQFMIMEDEFRYETFGKFPTNYNDILDEYDVYHENGGNGKITKRVEEYKKWYEKHQEHQNAHSQL